MDRTTNREIEKVKFLEEIDGICKKYNLSISHEDICGGFIIDVYDEDNIERLKAARFHHRIPIK